MLPSSITAVRRINSAPQLSQDSVLQDTIAKARNAIGRGDVHAAVRDLSACLNDQCDFHDAILRLLDSSPDHMWQELIQRVRSQRPDFDLNAHNREGKTVLDLAVQHKDLGFARYLLGLGAKPEQVSLGSASYGMEMLITSWRRKNILYAHVNGSNRQNWTPFDRALYEGHHEKMRAWLANVLMKIGVQKAWKDAMNAGRRDILRVLLVAGTPDELFELTKDKYLVGQWLDSLRDDPGLSAVLKEFPYQSAKRGKPEDFNDIEKFPGIDEEISCRHLVTYQQEMQAQDPCIKFDYDQFSSREKITANVKPDTEKKFAALKAQASETHLIENSQFGIFLAGQFEAMEKDGKQSKLMLVKSTGHVMNLGLRIKKKNGKKSYVVKLFDPGDTTTGTRSKTHSVKTFETQTLDSYITNPDDMENYYSEPVGMSMIFVRPEGNAQESISPGSSVDRTLTNMGIKNIDGTVIWLLMSEGFAGNLRKLHDHFTTLTENQRIELLATTRNGGYSALFMSMQNGHAEAVKIYSELLKQPESTPEDQLIELLAATSPKGAPALFMGMQEGHAEAVKAYGELLKQFESIPMDQLIELIAAEDDEDAPALFIGMAQGRAEAVKAYGELLKQFESIPMNQLIELIAAKNSNGTSALFMGMQEGHAETVKAYGELLKQFESIPEDQLIELLSATTADGTPALHMSMQEGHVETVKAYGDLVKSVSPDKQVDLLVAKIPCGEFKGKSGLQIALEDGSFKAANELLQLLTQLAPDLTAEKRAMLHNELKDYEKTYKRLIPANSFSLREWSKLKRPFSALESELSK